MISGLSSNCAVKLSTLDGEEMDNWINGCRIKKYNTPLTIEELERLQKSRWRQEKKKLVAKMDQDEARERAQKCKEQGLVVPIAMGLSKHHKFNIITNNIEKDEDITPPPSIAIQLGKE